MSTDNETFGMKRASFLARLKEWVEADARQPQPTAIRQTMTSLTYMTTSDGYAYNYGASSAPSRAQNRTRPVFLVLDADGRTPIPENDPVKWQRWMSHSPLRILKEETLKDGTRVSTVFVGVPGSLWETEVAGGEAEHDAHMSYMTYAAAETGHMAIVAELSRGTRGIRIRE